MDDNEFYENVMVAVIKKLTSDQMRPDELLKTRKFIKFIIRYELYEYDDKQPEFFVININQGLVLKQLRFVKQLQQDILDSYEKAVEEGKFPCIEASDYSDFASIQEPKDILFNLEKVAVSLQQHRRKMAYQIAKIEGNSTFSVDNFVARLTPVYLDQSHQMQNMQIQPQKKPDRYELVLEWMEKQEILHTDLLCNQLRIQTAKRKKRYFSALARYLFDQRNAINKMRLKIAARYQRTIIQSLKVLLKDQKIGKSVRIKQLKRFVNDPVIGIHLGNLHSSIGVARNGRVEVLESYGVQFIPSIVTYTDDYIFVGKTEKYLAINDPKRVIFQFQDLIGHKFVDKKVQNAIEYLPYDVIEKNGDPYVSIQVKNGNLTQSPEQIQCKIINKMKQIAENFHNRSLKYAVVVVPSSFDHTQTQAIIDACRVSGILTVKIIQQQIAAVLGLKLEEDSSEKNVFVIDFDGNTLDVSLVNVENGNLSTVCYTSVECFEEKLVEFIQNKNKICLDDKQLQILKQLVRKQKQEYMKGRTDVMIKFLINSIEFQESYQAIAEQLCVDLIKSELLQQILSKTGLDKSEIKQVIFLGLQKYKNDSEFSSKTQFINTNQLIYTKGAARLGDILGQFIDEKVPLSIGIRQKGGLMMKMIPRGASIPFKKSHIFTTEVDQQESLAIDIFRGARLFCQDNFPLGRLEMKGIQPAPQGVQKFEILFSIDNQSNLSVSLTEQSTGKKVIKTFKGINDYLTSDDIKRLVSEAEKYADKDNSLKDRIEALQQLEHYICQVSTLLEEFSGKIDAEDKSMISDALAEAYWFSSTKDANKDDFQSYLEMLQFVCEPVVEKFKPKHAAQNGKQLQQANI